MNKFSFSRFVDVLKKEWSEYFRAYGIWLIVWSCLPVVIWITSLVFDVNVEAGTRALFIYYVMFLSMMNVSEKVYGKVNLPRDGVAYSMLPATSVEKFFSMLLYCSIVTPVFCFAGCMLMDFLMSLLPFGGFKGFIILPIRGQGELYLLLILFLIVASAVFMFGNLVFKKRKAGKTLAWTFLILFVLILIIRLVFGIWLSIDESTFEDSTWMPYVILAVLAVGFYFGTFRKIKTQKY